MANYDFAPRADSNHEHQEGYIHIPETANLPEGVTPDQVMSAMNRATADYRLASLRHDLAEESLQRLCQELIYASTDPNSNSGGTSPEDHIMRSFLEKQIKDQRIECETSRLVYEATRDRVDIIQQAEAALDNGRPLPSDIFKYSVPFFTDADGPGNPQSDNYMGDAFSRTRTNA